MSKIIASQNLASKKVLLIDDEEELLEINKFQLDHLGIENLTANSGIEALKILKSNHVDLIVSDIKMPQMNGIELLKAIRDIHLDTPILFMSGYSDFTEKEVLKLGASALIAKPVSMASLIENLEAIAQKNESK